MAERPGEEEAASLLTDLFALGAAQKRALLEQGDGVLSADQVAERLGISSEAVEQGRREHRLLGIPCDAGYDYPACQFEAATVMTGLADILGEFGLERPWQALAFLLTPDDRLQGLSPLGALKRRDPRLTAMTVRLARGDAAADGFG